MENDTDKKILELEFEYLHQKMLMNSVYGLTYHTPADTNSIKNSYDEIFRIRRKIRRLKKLKKIFGE